MVVSLFLIVLLSIQWLGCLVSESNLRLIVERTKDFSNNEGTLTVHQRHSRKLFLRSKKGKKRNQSGPSSTYSKDDIITAVFQRNLRGPPVPYAISDFNYFSRYRIVCSKLRASSSGVEGSCGSSDDYFDHFDAIILVIAAIAALISNSKSKDRSSMTVIIGTKQDDYQKAIYFKSRGMDDSNMCQLMEAQQESLTCLTE